MGFSSIRHYSYFIPISQYSKLIEIEGCLATVYLSASFEETQSALVMHFQPYSGAGLTFRIPCP